MMIRLANRVPGRIEAVLPLACLLLLAACHSSDTERAGQMTSFSQRASASATPQLFTIPQDQMAHVQVVTIEPATLKHTLRLTGAVSTTPSIPLRSLPRLAALSAESWRFPASMLRQANPCSKSAARITHSFLILI